MELVQAWQMTHIVLMHVYLPACQRYKRDLTGLMQW